MPNTQARAVPLRGSKDPKWVITAQIPVIRDLIDQRQQAPRSEPGGHGMRDERPDRRQDPRSPAGRLAPVQPPGQLRLTDPWITSPPKIAMPRWAAEAAVRLVI